MSYKINGEYTMIGEKHDLAHEFPNHKDKIRDLKMHDAHFLSLYEKYNETTKEIEKIESGANNTSDDYLDGLKKERLALKDELFSLLNT